VSLLSKTNKFQLSIGNSQYSVSISEKAYGLYDVKVNDETFKISIADLLSPSIQNASSVPANAATTAASGAPIGGGSATASAGTVKAAMPGTVMAIKMKVGDAVKVGDIILTLETMKMENPLKSTKAGKIKEVSVKPGMFVNVGDKLVVIE
jgi:biotin carboxyl carrier protein